MKDLKESAYRYDGGDDIDDAQSKSILDEIEWSGIELEVEGRPYQRTLKKIMNLNHTHTHSLKKHQPIIQ